MFQDLHVNPEHLVNPVKHDLRLMRVITLFTIGRVLEPGRRSVICENGFRNA
jgi:hypothetical protein